MKKKIFSICNVNHKGIKENTPITFFRGDWYTVSDVKKVIKRKNK